MILGGGDELTAILFDRNDQKAKELRPHAPIFPNRPVTDVIGLIGGTPVEKTKINGRRPSTRC